ncbi:MAG: type II toxin-antitoxin system HicB family antitoxin [Dehalococcoidia bacterium]|jgi:predicted RNase H-like HicB family nuclease
MKREFTGIIEKQGKWYAGYIEEIPGVNTQGRTLKEVRENLKEALELIIEANRELYARKHTEAPIVRESIEINI